MKIIILRKGHGNYKPHTIGGVPQAVEVEAKDAKIMIACGVAKSADEKKKSFNNK